MICKLWHEDGEPLREICKVNSKFVTCCADMSKCQYPQLRKIKEDIEYLKGNFDIQDYANKLLSDISKVQGGCCGQDKKES